MLRVIKWLLIVLAALLVLLVAAVVIIPQVVDINDYKPQISSLISENLNRPVRLAGDIELSIFPWAGVAFSDFRVGNPDGFEKRTFLSVESFDVQVKALPLLFKEIRVNQFVLNGPEIFLIRNDEGRGNWEGIGPEKKQPQPSQAPPEASEKGELPIDSLNVREFAVKNGRLVWIDHTSGVKREIADIGLELADISLDQEIRAEFSARINDRPVGITGNFGPIGKAPGQADIPVDMRATAFDEMELELTGKVSAPIEKPAYKIRIEIASFSPRRVCSALGKSFPIDTSDTSVFTKAALDAKISGDTRSASIKNGKLVLDDSNLRFRVDIRDMEKPTIEFDFQLDRLNLDRYLPEASGKAAAKQKSPNAARSSPEASADYTSLRRPQIKGRCRVAQLTAGGATIDKLDTTLDAKKGRYQFDPVEVELYSGSVAGTLMFDVSTDTPNIQTEITVDNIKSGRLLADVADQAFLEGLLQADMSVNASGNTADRFRQTVSGAGDIRLYNGVIKGFDLAEIIRNIQTTLGLPAHSTDAVDRTDFSELLVPFNIKDGKLSTTEAKLISPVFRVNASGTADLADETLDFTVRPKLVATLKGQSDTEKRAGLQVPLKVSGTFTNPKVRPDYSGLDSLIKDTRPSQEEVNEKLKDLEDLTNDTLDQMKEDAGKMLEGVFGN